MSLSAAAKAAANHLAKDVKAKKPALMSKAQTLLTFEFQPNPRPINCCTFPITRTIAADISHPLYIRTQRRMEAFDPTILHWAVRAPLNLSKKATVRWWAGRRIKAAFREVLKEAGLDSKGRRTGTGVAGLNGALRISTPADHKILDASGEEVKKECARILQQVMRKQKAPRGNGSQMETVQKSRSRDFGSELSKGRLSDSLPSDFNSAYPK